MNDTNSKLVELSNQWFELASDAYRTYLNSLVWGQERLLEMTKTMSGQVAETHNQSRTLLDEYTGQLQRGQELVQNTWRDNYQNTMSTIKQYRQDSNANLAELSDRMDRLQNKVEA